VSCMPSPESPANRITTLSSRAGVVVMMHPCYDRCGYAVGTSAVRRRSGASAQARRIVAGRAGDISARPE
jgi:hypothetical protein